MIITALALTAALLSPTAANAERDPSLRLPTDTGAPVADLRVFASDGRVAHRGALMNGSSATLCVASSTGRYRLRIVSNSGGAMRGSDTRSALGYRVRFRDASGAEQVKQMTNGEIAFEGRSPGQVNCSGGANAFVVIDSPETEILANVAGEYVDRLTLSVDPL